MNRIGRVILRLFAAIGVIGVILHAVRWWHNNHLPGDATVTGTTKSPNGNHLAVTFTEAGGGGLDPYCFKLVTVVKAGTLPEDAWDQDANVFTGSCMAHLSLNWISDHALEITFDPALAAEGVGAVKTKRYADGGRVKLTYRVRAGALSLTP